MTDTRPLEIALVTGMSGAGRSTAARALEDVGWFVMDNLPPALLSQAIELAIRTEEVNRIAVVVDVRSGSMFNALEAAVAELKSRDILVRTLFLEASDEALVRRFESSRRPHPLQGQRRITDGLQAERVLLGDLRAEADVVIDTSAINVHDLRRKVEAAFADETPDGLRATVLSFGFKYGIPVDADLVADMRFLENPHWDERLRPMSGLDQPVSEIVVNGAEAQRVYALYVELLEVMRPGYLTEGKRYVTIAVGCTGGKHRSVASAEELARRLRQVGIATLVVHRDLGRE
ncbi:MAG: RNase adapter RapZ [Actinomycetota bacterium]|nr:RNase adapter RapZ [Actinomycetota bacterium]MDP2288632.1 RNase adapter RapZ [Actinomycetota bacterium]